MSTFVSLGNNKKDFSRILNFVENNYHELSKPVILQLGHTCFNPKYKFKKFKFLNQEDFSRIVSQAKILIIHGGAGTIIKSLQQNKKPFVMPRLMRFNEHINDHQLELCNELSKDNKIYLINEESKINNFKFEKTKLDYRNNLNLKMLETSIKRMLK